MLFSGSKLNRVWSIIFGIENENAYINAFGKTKVKMKFVFFGPAFV